MAGKLNNGRGAPLGRHGDEEAHALQGGLRRPTSATSTIKLRDDLSGTFDGDLTLDGPPLEPTLGGSLIVSHMKYVEDLDLEKSLLDFLAAGRRRRRS